jgi:type II secretion system protein D
MNFGFGHLGHRAKSMTHSASLAILGKSKFLILCSMVCALCLMLFAVELASAQRREGGLGDEQAKVTERDEEGKAEKLSFFNVINADIHAILRFMSDETNLTMIASDKVQGKVSLVNLTDITVNEALEALKTALNTLGFTTVRVNKTIVIIPLDEAKTKPVRVQVGSDPEQIESIDEMITQIMPLNYADAAEMVQNLKNLIPKSGDMFADTTNNALIITDSSSNIRRIALILKELDAAPGEFLKTRVFQLKYADARSLQQTLERLFGQGVEMARGLQRMSSRGADEVMKRMQQAREQGRIPGRGIDFVKGLVIISADERTNKLIITASEENLEIIAQMIEQLDTSEVAQAEIKVFLLDYAVAEDVAEALEDLLQGSESRRLPPWERWRARERGGSGAKGIQGEVNIVSDDRMNAVIVSSDPQNFPLIENIINQLDQQVAPQEVMKIFQLKYADAETVVENLQDLFQGSSDRDMPWWERERRRRDRRDRGREEQVTGIQGTVNLIADVRLNSVIVSTAAANIPVIEGLIKRLDITVPDLESATRIFPLQNADAENLADILGNMFQGGQSRDRFFWLPRSSRQSRGATVTGTIDVSAYPRTNSLVVTTSSARNFEIIEGLIKDLDQETPSDFKQKTLIYPLEYSDAEEMSDLLNDIFSEGGGGYSRQRQRRERSFFRMMMGQSTSMLKDMSTLAGQVQVNADAQTNTLIITTPERNFEAVKEMIAQLDIVRGQVWLQIMVVEVTLTDDTKLGLEWSWQEGRHLGKEDLTGQFGTDFQLDQEGIGFSYKVFNKNLTALLHTLMRENEVTVLSTPSLLTRDNQTAEWRVGKDIPYLESTRTDNFGNIMYDYNFLQDIGINIRITPHIAKAGNLERLKAGEKRTVGLDIETVNVSNFIEYTDFNAPVTSDSTVTTYVDVEDGEQIVIGGMIRSEEKNTTHQIPILGSIPFLGRLFKKTEKVQENTEILLLITPRIIDINREEDREVLKQLQSEQLSEKDRELIQNNNKKIEKPSANQE